MYDYLIVGQGIAGSLLALELLENNKTVCIIDDFNPNSSSNIATGVFNPITGRKFVKSWMVDELIPICLQTYSLLEEKFQSKFLYKNNINKIFTDEKDLQLWNKRKNDIEYKNYLGEIINIDNANINAPFGAGEILNSFWLDMPLLMKKCRNYFIQKNILLDATFNYENLKVNETIQYENIEATHLVFCEGFKTIFNPYFNFIPFTTAKGEYLIFSAEKLNLSNIINRNFILLPIGNNLYSFGSTFIWNDLIESVTEDGKEEIKNKLDKILNCEYTILDTKAGIRPTIKDRRPVLGTHYKFKNIHIFNGLGTKGVSLTPYFSKHFVQSILLNTEILKDVSISRFFSKVF